jgi:ABC-type Fe3+/spermidine/putrescine transport system ATPase subunit
MRRRAGETLALVGLRNLAERIRARMSGARQQRWRCARDSSPSPACCSLDEPSIPTTTPRLREDMRSSSKLMLHRLLGPHHALVTHAQEEP